MKQYRQTLARVGEEMRQYEHPSNANYSQQMKWMRQLQKAHNLKRVNRLINKVLAA